MLARFIYAFFIALFSSIAFAQAPQQPIPTLTGTPLIDAVSRGGYVIYFRHGTSGEGKDQDALGLGPCTNQRQLSPLGRIEAGQIGASFKRFNIPVGRVLVSPYCRAQETAFIAFGEGQVLYDLRLWHGELPAAEREALPRAVKRLLATSPQPGTNTILVSHQNTEALGVELREGEAAVVKPEGGEKFTLVAKVLAAQWDAHFAPPAMPGLLEFALPQGSQPYHIAPAGDGMVWYAGGRTRNIGRLNSFTASTQRIDLPGAVEIVGLTAAADGGIWIADGGAYGLLRYQPKDGTFTTTVLPHEPADGALGDIITTPDGVVWFLTAGYGFGRHDPRSGANMRFAADREFVRGTWVVQGERLFASRPGAIVEIDRTSGAIIRQIEVPTAAMNIPRFAFTADGRLWAAHALGSWLGVRSPDGKWQDFRRPIPPGGSADLFVDHADQLWLVDRMGNVVRFDAQQKDDAQYQALKMPSGPALPTEVRSSPFGLWVTRAEKDSLIYLRLQK